MKKLLLLAVLAAGATAARAQGAPSTATPPPPGPLAVTGPNGRPTTDPVTQAQRQSQRLARELGLSADQQARVQQILLQQRQDLLAVRQQAGGNRRGMGRALKTERQQADEQLRAVLTPEQYARYQQLLTQRKQQLLERRQQKQGSSLLD